MQIDALPSVGLIPNGPRVRQELVKAISYCEVLSDAHVAAAPQLVLNGEFDADTNWTKAGGATIAGGVASFVGADSTTKISQAMTGVAVGEVIELEVFVSSRVSGGVRFLVGGAATGTFSALGLFRTSVAMGSADSLLAVQSFDGAADLKIDHVKVYRSSTRNVEQAKTLDTFLSSARTAIAGLVDSALPTLGSAVIPAGGAKMTLTFSELLDASVVPAVGQFVSSPAKTFSSVTVAGSTVTLVPTVAYAAGVTTIAYTQPATNSLRDASANLVATFGATAVTNNA